MIEVRKTGESWCVRPGRFRRERVSGAASLRELSMIVDVWKKLVCWWKGHRKADLIQFSPTERGCVKCGYEEELTEVGWLRKRHWEEEGRR